MTDSSKGKPCPVCGEPMSDLASQFVRMCTGCHNEWEWKLDEGQQPLITPSRDRGLQS